MTSSLHDNDMGQQNFAAYETGIVKYCVLYYLISPCSIIQMVISARARSMVGVIYSAIDAWTDYSLILSLLILLQKKNKLYLIGYKMAAKPNSSSLVFSFGPFK